jgi:outer membrane murein-binding lipoprotein Lpp
MVVATFVTVVWATHSVTGAQAQVQHLNSVVRQLSDTSDAREREIEALREDVSDARVAAARVEGELSAAKTQVTVMSATTKPVSVMQYLMDRVTMR